MTPKCPRCVRDDAVEDLDYRGGARRRFCTRCELVFIGDYGELTAEAMGPAADEDERAINLRAVRLLKQRLRRAS